MTTTANHLPTYTGSARAHTGGPRTPRSLRFERNENTRSTVIAGTHMPLDTEAHWTWRNPLNILPLLIIVLFVFALLGTIVTLIW